MTTEFNRTPLTSRNYKLMNNERMLAKTEAGHWFLIKRIGQRSWEAICVAQGSEEAYSNIAISTIHGNSSNLLRAFHAERNITELYRVYNQREYRQAIMSIMISGHIDRKITAEFE